MERDRQGLGIFPSRPRYFQLHLLSDGSDTPKDLHPGLQSSFGTHCPPYPAGLWRAVPRDCQTPVPKIHMILVPIVETP